MQKMSVFIGRAAPWSLPQDPGFVDQNGGCSLWDLHLQSTPDRFRWQMWHAACSFPLFAIKGRDQCVVFILSQGFVLLGTTSVGYWDVRNSTCT